MTEKLLKIASGFDVRIVSRQQIKVLAKKLLKLYLKISPKNCYLKIASEDSTWELKIRILSRFNIINNQQPSVNNSSQSVSQTLRFKNP